MVEELDKSGNPESRDHHSGTKATSIHSKLIIGTVKQQRLISPGKISQENINFP